ncbi:PQQ-binding-like beta-propeller repeat protein [Streptomyces coeruleoprunus]|uniref:PQQ-binding-like beta-propeller repeat protein n=1 Tax=Streptomyces coeruleoprunus TaxID=285563 RepID=A0ABV9XNT1_9ACTN
MPSQPLRADDPRHVGPYAVFARFGESASAVRYLAQGPGGGTVMVAVPRPDLAELPAFRRRFAAEARTAELLAGGWVPEPADAERTSWTATAYVPALTLGEAVALAGPLPERAVRVLGAGLAETLSRVHATGTVLRGLAPDTVLLAADGPRLTAFGALGAAVAVEAGPGGHVSVRLGHLTPEQVAGEEPGAPSDIFVLGLLLAYAATGAPPLPPDAAGIATAEADLGAVPEGLRALLADCLAKSPESRPTAGEAAAALALEGAAALARDGWLPPRLEAALKSQPDEVGALRAAAASDAATTPTSEVLPTAGTPTAGPLGATGAPTTKALDAAGTPVAGPQSTASTPAAGPQNTASAPAAGPQNTASTPAAGPQNTPSTPAAGARTPAGGAWAGGQAGPLPAGLPAVPSGGGPSVGAGASVLPIPLPPPPPAGEAAAPSRRALFVGVAAGAAGLVVGGGAGALLRGERSGPAPVPDAEPVVRPRPSVAGVAPQPRWRYEHPETPGEALRTAVWRDRTLVLTSDADATAVDLATGRRLWRRAEGASLEAARPAGDDLLFVAGREELLWLSAATGAVAHRLRLRDRIPGVPGVSLVGVAGQDGATVWFTGAHGTVTSLFAFDVVRRALLWRTPLPPSRAPYKPRYSVVVARPDAVVMAQDPLSVSVAQNAATKGMALFRSFDRATGRQRWARPFGAVRPGAAATGDGAGRLLAPVGAGELHAHDLESRKRLWRLTGASLFGPVAPHEGTLFVANRAQTVYAVDPATGRPRWQRPTEAAPGRGVPRVTVSAGTVLVADGSQVTAFAAADGRRLWKFQDAGAQDPRARETTAGYAASAAGRTAVVQRGRTFYGLPLSG